MKNRLPVLALAPLLAFVALLAWVFASPIGAGPDDDYHLVSTWCASVVAAAPCDDTGDTSTREVPETLIEISCFAGDSRQSAGCQDRLSWNLRETVESDRGNFVGAYPPVYYAVNAIFAGDDVQLSGLVMRIATAVLFLTITVALFQLLPIRHRPSLVLGWLVSTIPLGIFLLASNNPSAWAAIGVGSSWLALVGYFETTGRRRIALGALFGVSVVLAAGSRGDAALFVGFGIALVLLYKFARRREFFLASILPLAMGLVALVFFLGSRQTSSGFGGFSGGSGGGDAAPEPENLAQGLSGFGRLAYNLLNAPFIWVGNLGEWGLGWLDTDMPSVVSLASVAAFVAVGFLGIRRMSWRKAIMLTAVVLVLWLLPVYVLQQGGGIVGEQVQPRYLLPLVVLLGGMLLLNVGDGPFLATRTQRLVVAGALAVAHLVALHTNLRRYVTGVEAAGFNLDFRVEWWWDGMPFSPMAVWIIGSLAYAALVFLLAERVGRDAVSASAEGAPLDAATARAEPSPAAS